MTASTCCGVLSLLLRVLALAGNLGRFNFQVFLLSLVSSVALLAASSAVVKFLAFYVLPNRCVPSACSGSRRGEVEMGGEG